LAVAPEGQGDMTDNALHLRCRRHGRRRGAHRGGPLRREPARGRGRDRAARARRGGRARGV